MKHDEFERLLGDVTREYNVPPNTPREAMWAEIVEQRRHRRPGRPTWHWWGLGMAATLLLGVAAGRFGARPTQPAASAVAEQPVTVDSAALQQAFQLAALEHLRQAETFLVVFKAGAERGGSDDATARPAHDLLVNTRLLRDSPAADDPQMRLLLDDLEFVLTQIVQLRSTRQRHGEELQFVEDGIEQSGVLFRLRSALSGDPRHVAVQGD